LILRCKAFPRMVRVWEFFGPVTIQLGRIQTNRYVFAD
jgi:hypothetical protein